ncbi:Methyltransferase type 11 [Rhodomicrobium vannielii ATCC 17100]|uniref:Methyltransferase type 11 n=1 Tax=Rhodomicrobium vannielii (strain ATCC 17100 / DSM 162 / LMG 4299 / NCIMB 10020 / ATH 3.1.1) TaxID=648757 RepID=E3I7D4_RHOVT|nr:class I SAM-dependent methyltransferase [Rhodomicrobium vannielii]ADP71853.1 Methyltransferase type 11 [Rhodomicrobium vannielii ATCC 17100]
MAENGRSAEWNGRKGEIWVVNHERIDRMLAPLGRAALDKAAPKPGESVLDVGCGAGTTTFLLADKVGASGSVLGVDISEPMLSFARKRAATAAPGLPVRFELADAATYALPHAQFDLLFSRFGVMFFADPVAAFANLHRAMKPGGRLCFVCWRPAAENELVSLPARAVKGLIPPAPPAEPNAPGPFSFGDPARVTSILSAAGFSHIALEPFGCRMLYGVGETRDAAIEDAVEQAFETGPFSRVLAELQGDVREQARKAVRAAFAERAEDGGVFIQGNAWIVTALVERI